MTFVQRSGSQLTLGGKPFYPMGFNLPYSISNVANQPVATQLPNWPKTCNAARLFAFQGAFVVNGAIDWAVFDAAMAAFEARGIYAIISLGDQYAWNDGVEKTADWYTTGYKTVLAGEVMTYRNWVAQVVTRYAAHPAVLCWELMNEPKAEGGASELAEYQTLLAFLNDIGAMTNAIDSNHLFSLGNCIGFSGSGHQWEGSVQNTAPPTAPTPGSSDWELLAENPYVDILMYHDYGFPNQPMGITNPLVNIQAAVNIAEVVSKPLIIGEQGIEWVQGDAPSQGTITPWTQAERAACFKAKWTEEFKAGVAGVVAWCWVNSPKAADGAGGWGMEIGIGDPALPYMDPSLYVGATPPPPPPTLAAQVDAVLSKALSDIATILAGH